jgi:hypothetical protein
VDEETGLSYIAMEYIEGRSLKNLSAAFAGRRGDDAAITALDYAHAQA